jgi:hypothetical protein
MVHRAESTFRDPLRRRAIARLRAIVAATAAIFMFVTCWSRDAHAYGWMIRHEYAACTQCHSDPSGGSLLTLYGRAQSEILLRTYYGKGDGAERDPGETGNFAFGAVHLPDALLLQGDFRGLGLAAFAGGGQTDVRTVHMQSDFIAQLTVGRFRQNVSVGYMHKGAPAAWLLGRAEEHHLVSRHHWLGFDIGEDNQFLLRVGRMNLPFGLRSIEHTSFVRRATRTDINTGQQHGVALAYNAAKIRFEVMAIAGNFQVSPDVFRERGYSGYVEWAPSLKLAVGASSLVTHVAQDPQLNRAQFRQAHGVFGRFVPAKSLVLMAETDILAESEPRKPIRVGFAGMLSADFEPTQGVHAMTTFELKNAAVATEGTSVGAWLSGAWFFAPHADLRADFIWRSEPAGAARNSSIAILGQLHFFL